MERPPVITDWDGYCEMDGLCLQVQFNPLQYSTPCFREIQRTIEKFRQNKKIWIAKATLREKQCWRHHNRVMVINIAWGWYKTRHVDLLGEKGDPDVNIHSYTTHFWQNLQKYTLENKEFLQKMGLGKLCIHTQKEIDPYFLSAWKQTPYWLRPWQ